MTSPARPPAVCNPALLGPGCPPLASSLPHDLSCSTGGGGGEDGGRWAVGGGRWAVGRGLWAVATGRGRVAWVCGVGVWRGRVAWACGVGVWRHQVGQFNIGELKDERRKIGGIGVSTTTSDNDIVSRHWKRRCVSTTSTSECNGNGALTEACVRPRLRPPALDDREGLLIAQLALPHNVGRARARRARDPGTAVHVPGLGGGW